MSDFQKINMFEQARKRLFEGTLSVNDFKVIVDECSKSPFGIITQKIKEMGEAAIREVKIREKRKKEGLSPYPDFCDFEKVNLDDVLD